MGQVEVERALVTFPWVTRGPVGEGQGPGPGALVVRPKGGDSNTERREQYMQVQRRMCAIRVSVSSPPGTVYPDDGLRRAVPDGGAAAIARLARLEAGEPVRVRGDQVGLANDTTVYTLEGDGSLTPVP